MSDDGQSTILPQLAKQGDGSGTPHKESAETTTTALSPPAPAAITTTAATNPALAPVLAQLSGIADQLAAFEGQLAHIDEALANQVIAAREDVNKVTKDVEALLLCQKQTFAANLNILAREIMRTRMSLTPPELHGEVRICQFWSVLTGEPIPFMEG